MPRRWSALEQELRVSRGPLLAGVDEVGRGPLAGPVVACAVVMPPESRAIRGVDDSKALDGPEREKLAKRIRERALAIGIGAASVREIDRINIYHAAVLAIRRAITRLPVMPHHVLIDGNPIRTLGIEHTAVVGGDACCHSIACASIVAKVTRDRLMRALARRHPHYRWETNVGYGTAEHHAGLASHGITAHHRRSFTPVAQLNLALEVAPPAEAQALADALQDILAPESAALRDVLAPEPTLQPDVFPPESNP
ncbi:MAG: ribonuclease HII [Gemmatimonadetes bacterium]|nr:ribonuclease HII [Gemmatimonadota bacterium]